MRADQIYCTRIRLLVLRFSGSRTQLSWKIFIHSHCVRFNSFDFHPATLKLKLYPKRRRKMNFELKMLELPVTNIDDRESP
jgi:hypothetical protein